MVKKMKKEKATHKQMPWPNGDQVQKLANLN